MRNPTQNIKAIRVVWNQIQVNPAQVASAQFGQTVLLHKLKIS